MQEKTGYPLCWPLARPRTPLNQRRVARFKTSFAVARDRLIDEIRRLGGGSMIFSSNIPLRNDGLPRSQEKPESNDAGIAVYFTRKGKELCFCCDCYYTVDDNMHAICLTIEALRGIARWGTGDMMEAAFTGFAGLPAPGQSAGESPWQILGLPVNFTEEQLKDAYRELAKKHHPDTGGDAASFARVKNAYDLLAQNLRK